MSHESLDHVERRLLAFLAMGRTVPICDTGYLAWVTGLDETEIEPALRRMQANGLVRTGTDGHWSLA